MKRLILPTLLLVSDNSSIRYWVKSHLDTQFFILEARNAANALSNIHNSSIDFILLDADMENPLALCKKIRAALHNAIVPILLITGKLKKSFREEALDAGVTDFLSTHLDTEELQTRIAAAKQAEETREKTSEISKKLHKKP